MVERVQTGNRATIMARYFDPGFCTPIGHAGAPLPQSWEPESQFATKAGEKDPQQDRYSSYMLLLRLPLEIKMRITRHLSQCDLVNLAVASSAFYDAAMFALYEDVVIDSEAGATSCITGERVAMRGVSVLKSRFAVKRFTAIMQAHVPFPFGALVKSLRVWRLPAGMSKSDSIEFVQRVFPSLVCLKRLQYTVKRSWVPENILRYVPASVTCISLPLTTMDGSLQRRFTFTKLSCSAFYHSTELQKFMQGLREILWDPCISLSCLQLRRDDEVSPCHSRNLNVGQSLIVTQYMLDNNLPQPGSTEADVKVFHNQLDVGFWGFLNVLGRLENIKELGVSDTNFCATDAATVRQYINLSAIETLCFSGINEVQWLPEVSYGVSDMRWLASTHLRKGFLSSIASDFVRLRKLKLDYKEAARDTIPELLATLASNHVYLNELDMVIRWDKTKTATDSWEHTAERYVEAIIAHRNALTKLSLIAKEDSSYYELHKNIPPKFLYKLTVCQNISSLRFYGGLLQSSGCDFLQRFSKLKYLDLCGKEAGGPPHMGLHTPHGGMLYDWYRVIHVPITLSRRIKTLEFIRIDTCLFECKKDGDVVPSPRNLDSWFHNCTRVIISG